MTVRLITKIIHTLPKTEHKTLYLRSNVETLSKRVQFILDVCTQCKNISCIFSTFFCTLHVSQIIHSQKFLLQDDVYFNLFILLVNPTIGYYFFFIRQGEEMYIHVYIYKMDKPLLQYSQRHQVINHCDRTITNLGDTEISFALFNSLCFNFFHLLARNPNLEKISIYSNKILS